MSTGLGALTLFHLALSLIGVFTGFVVVSGFVAARRFRACTPSFLITTAGTSVTGFLFPFHKILPSHILGILSLLALGPAIYAYYVQGLKGQWRTTYVVCTVVAQYLNCFVLVAQMLMKMPALRALAPTQTEATFKATQLCVLVFFLFLGILSRTRFAGELTRT